MAVSKLNPVSGGKTRYAVTLLSGTSYTVPTGVTYINVTLFGGGGGGGTGYGVNANSISSSGLAGQMVKSIVTTTPGASITYAIGAGSGAGGQGGTTTFVGATDAVGGRGGTYTGTTNTGTIGTQSPGFPNGGSPGNGNVNAAGQGGVGGAGSIEIEYWV